MNRVHLLSIIFLIIAVIAFIPLTIEVFGDMKPDVMSASAIVVGVGIVGSSVCSIVRAICKSKGE